MTRTYQSILCLTSSGSFLDSISASLYGQLHKPQCSRKGAREHLPVLCQFGEPSSDNHSTLRVESSYPRPTRMVEDVVNRTLHVPFGDGVYNIIQYQVAAEMRGSKNALGPTKYKSAWKKTTPFVSLGSYLG